MQLSHEELILLARLLGHHMATTGHTPLESLAERLLEYAERHGKVAPLQLEQANIAGHPNRVGFRLTSLNEGE